MANTEVTELRLGRLEDDVKGIATDTTALRKALLGNGKKGILGELDNRVQRIEDRCVMNHVAAPKESDAVGGKFASKFGGDRLPLYIALLALLIAAGAVGIDVQAIIARLFGPG